ncbi:MAG: IS1634 family transposase [Pseudonocardiaceae bacterium]
MREQPWTPCTPARSSCRVSGWARCRWSSTSGAARGCRGLLERYLPATDARVRLAPAAAVGLVVTNLLLGRAPLYGLGEWVVPFAPGLLGLVGGEVDAVNDDRVGRAPEQLFDADRASLLTELMLAVIAEFGVDTTELHNDSTSIRVHGAYQGATGAERGGKPTPVITFGHSKDHRPDLKQLVWILTVSADGAVPIAYRLADGNTTDDPTHIPTWDGLVGMLGRAGFLYIADSKLCSRAAMSHIATGGGRFVTVGPRSRSEDRWFARLGTDRPATVQRSGAATRAAGRAARPGVCNLPRAAALRRGPPGHLGALHRQGRPLYPELTPLHRQILGLLGISTASYTTS